MVDCAGNNAWIDVTREENRICFNTSESESCIYMSVKEAKELINEIKKEILKN